MKKGLLIFGLLFCLSVLPKAVHAEFVAGDLVKTASSSAVYYVTGYNTRAAFPDEQTFFTWYRNFDSVKTVTDEEMAALPLTKLVTMRPGVQLVKNTTSPMVYAVAHGGVLRWISSEEIAKMIYGVDWNKKIVDLPDEFFSSYIIGTDVTGPGQYWWKQEMDSSPIIAADLGERAQNAQGTGTEGGEADTGEETADTNLQKKNVLFILWDPKDSSNPAPDKSMFERMVYGAQPSVKDFFDEESNGIAKIVNAGVLGWYAADHGAPYYSSEIDEDDTDNDGFEAPKSQKYVEALNKASNDFDFKSYDANGDGKLKPDELAIFIVTPQNTPEFEEADVLSTDYPEDKPFTVDGVEIGSVGDLYLGNPILDRTQLGTVAYGVAHYVFGLDELTAGTPGSSPYVIGNFTLMASPHSDLRIDPYNRMKAGWITPKTITADVSAQQLASSDSSRPVLRIDRDQPKGPGKGTEYLLVENRERGAYDNDLPDVGLAIWDVYSSSVYLVRNNPTDTSDLRALWQRRIGTIGAGTTPEILWASDKVRSGITFSAISEAGGSMDFTLTIKKLTEYDLRDYYPVQ